MAKSIPIPQFSIRWLLTVTVACAVVFSVFGIAVREYHAGYQGSCWATAVSVAVVSLVLVFVVYAGVFATAWAASQITAWLMGRRPGAGRSPFRHGFPLSGPAVLDPSGGEPQSEDGEASAAPIVLD